MPRDVDTALLRTFAAVVDGASLTAAARRLNVTQAAVSLRLRRLEEALEVRLLERSARGVSLTVDGERLVGPAREAIRASDALTAAAHKLSGDRTIRLGASPNLVNGWLPDVLRRVSARNPARQVTLLSAPTFMLLDAAADGRLDVAVVQRESGTGDGEELRSEPLAWVGARGGEAWRRRPLPVASAAPLCSYRKAVTSALEASGRDWEAVPETETYDARIALLRADAAVGVMQPSLMPGDLQILSDERLPPLPAFATFVHQAAEPSSIVRGFSSDLVLAIRSPTHAG